MPLFLKENQELQDNMYDIPKELEDHLKDTLSQYKEYGTTAAGTMSKGFKRLQSLVDPNYNKQDDNTSKDGHRQISYSDMKRIDHDFRHMSKNPHDLQRVLNGGDEMASWVKNTLNRDRTKVEPVLKQKKVETRNKNAVKPTVAPMKPIEVGNISANVHEGKKIIYISEEQLNILKEYRDQLELPFHNDDTITTPYAKPNYQHYIDFLESIGKYGQLPISNCDIKKYMETYFDDALEDWWEEESNRFNNNELRQAYLNEFFDQHDNDLYNLFKLPQNEVDEYISDDDYVTNLFDYYLSPYGEEQWRSYLTYRFEDELSAYDFPNKLTINDRGLIYVERTIILPQLNSYQFATSINGKSTDLYKHLTRRYDGVGICWTWARNAGEAYNGTEFSTSYKPTNITLRGWVRCEDISWEETIMMNAYCLAHEREIRLQHGAQVEVIEVVLDDGKKLPLNHSIIVVA